MSSVDTLSGQYLFDVLEIVSGRKSCSPRRLIWASTDFRVCHLGIVTELNKQVRFQDATGDCQRPRPGNYLNSRLKELLQLTQKIIIRPRDCVLYVRLPLSHLSFYLVLCAFIVN